MTTLLLVEYDWACQVLSNILNLSIPSMKKLFQVRVRSLITLVSEHSETIQRVVSESLETLATSLESGGEDSGEIEDQLKTLSQINRFISSRIQAILTNTAGNLLSSGIIQGMIAYIG